MEEKLVSMLRYIQSHNQNNRKTIFDDIVKISSTRLEAQNGYYQLQNLGYIDRDLKILEKGINKLREIDEASDIQRRLNKNELDLIQK